MANRTAASRTVVSPITPGVLGDRQGMQVDDAMEGVGLVLAFHPVS